MHEPRSEQAAPSATSSSYDHLATPPRMIRWDLGERPAITKPKDRLCVVRVAGFLLAIAGRHSQGLRDIEDPTPIPLAPPHILGLAHVGGHILPVVDLSLFPDPSRPTAQPPSAAQGPWSTVILEVDDVRLCFVVDEVVAFEPFDMATTLTFSDSAAEAGGPNRGEHPWSNLLAGIAHLQGFEPLPVLDLDAAISALRLAGGTP